MEISKDNAAMDNLHVRQNFDLGKWNKIYYHSSKELRVNLVKLQSFVRKCCKIRKSLHKACKFCPRANGAKRRSGRKPGARVTNSAVRRVQSGRWGWDF